MVHFRYLLIVLVTLLMGSFYDRDNDQPKILAQTHSEARTIMYIKLRDGFNNDTVTITVNEKQVYSKSGVNTDLKISFADAVEVPVKESIVKLTVAVENGPTETKEIRVQETPFVDVWIIEGKMELRESKEDVPML